MKWIWILTAWMVLGGSALAYEEPRYEVVEKGEAFEIRRYEPFILAEVVVEGDFSEVGNEAFRILAGYIGGKNRRREKIPMTAPVGQEPAGGAGEKIPMTAPVIQAPGSGAEGAYRFSFVMPENYTLETLPEPEDSRIGFRRVEGRLMAARTYSGSWSERRYRENERRLLEALREKGLESVGAPLYARYNSPFTLWFLRRNEVLVEIRGGPQAPTR